MLNLIIGRSKEYLCSGNGWFDNRIDQSVVLTDFSRKIIKEVDGCEVISEYCIVSPVLGAITPGMLSGGVKSLMILMYSDDKIVSLSAMGDNCLKYLTDIARVKDFTMSTWNARGLYRNGFTGDIKLLNDGRIIANDLDILWAIDEFKYNDR